jgi:hypothetical protein
MSSAPSPAMDAAIEQLRLRAIRAVIFAKKTRVRKFIKQPWQLDSIYSELSYADARGAIAIAEHLIERDSAKERRMMGGEVPLINAHAVMLYGRALRRHERRQMREAA